MTTIGRGSGSPTSADGAERSRRFWGGRSAKPLTDEDEREIAENLTGFFKVLAEWDAADRKVSGDKALSGCLP